MKYFTEPNGKFVIKIPSEWQYKNKITREEEKPPFSFAPYKYSVGAFQLSIYTTDKKPGAERTAEIQKFDTDNLKFTESRLDGGGFNVHLWGCIVENNMFFAKYIYSSDKAKDKRVLKELKKAEDSLKTLEILSPNKSKEALIYDRYEKFMAALAASFDLKNKAMKNKSLIEFIIIVANQIDAYLRLSIVMTKQLKQKTNEIDISYLYQGEGDKKLMESRIYDIAQELEIIDEETYKKLKALYQERNKVVHRYIISEITTLDLIDYVYEYELICEVVRLKLQGIEDLQVVEKVGIYKNGTPDNSNLDKETLKMLHAQINDKHAMKEFYRKI